MGVPSFWNFDGMFLARTNLFGHSGDGIVVCEDLEYSMVPDAPLYVEYIPKVAEYRVIVVRAPSSSDNEVEYTAVDMKQKKKKRDFEGERDEYVWNCNSGYVFARNDIIFPRGLDTLGVSSIKALGLDFGAVDIIEDADGTLYVLEVNTAFGLEGQTISLVGDAIRELL